MADAALKALSPEFDRLYSKVGRPSIPPERLLRALLLQCFYGIRSERLVMERLEYNLLFRWFVGLSMDDTVWDATVSSKSRDRLLAGDIARRFLEQVVAQARERDLTSDGLVVDCEVTEALGQHMEREAAIRLMAHAPRANRATVGGDRAYRHAELRGADARARCDGSEQHRPEKRY